MFQNEYLSTYCLFCHSGKEDAIIERLALLGYSSFTPLMRGWKSTPTGVHKKISKLLPGYIFFDAAELSVKDWQIIMSLPYVVRVLTYGNERFALNNADKAFVLWLKSYDAFIEMSEAIQVGTRLHFIHGPLKDKSGEIIKVNKKRKAVLVSTGCSSSLLGSFWCSYDYAESNIDSSAR